MAHLLQKTAAGEMIRWPVRPGASVLGRAEGADLQIADGSVSSRHCEVFFEGGALRVRDLGSTNGTFIGEARAAEGVIAAGQTFRVGQVWLQFEDDAPAGPSAPPPPAAKPALSIPAIPPIPVPITRPITRLQVPAITAAEHAAAPEAPGDGDGCRRHPAAPAQWRCLKCAGDWCAPCAADGHKFGVPNAKFCPDCSSQLHDLKTILAWEQRDAVTFGQEMSRAWAYPFKGDGTMILLAGTVFFAISGFAQRYMFLIGLMIFVGTTGYWTAYAQKVASSSAQGEDEPPTWPDFSDYFQDIIIPFFQGAALFFFYLAPFFAALAWLPKDEPTTLLIAGALLLLALFLMPMAWLAVSVHESIAGLNPLFVIPSILRVPGQYSVVVILLIFVVGLNMALEWMFDRMRVPILPWLLSSFISLYFMMVMCRMLGAMYYRNRETLAWFKARR